MKWGTREKKAQGRDGRTEEEKRREHTDTHEMTHTRSRHRVVRTFDSTGEVEIEEQRMS